MKNSGAEIRDGSRGKIRKDLEAALKTLDIMLKTMKKLWDLTGE